MYKIQLTCVTWLNRSDVVWNISLLIKI